MFPLGTHLTLLNNLFILQKKGNRIAYGNLRANVSLLGSAFTPERSSWKPNSPIYKPSELLSQLQSCPLCLGYKDTHLWVVVRIRIICVKWQYTEEKWWPLWIDVTKKKEHLVLPGAQQAPCTWQLIHSIAFCCCCPLCVLGPISSLLFVLSFPSSCSPSTIGAKPS